MRIALYQPEIAGNMGAVMRIAACFAVPIDVIEPTGFVFSDARMRRAGMDYIDQVVLTRHADWAAFRAAVPGRLVLMSTHARTSIYETAFEPEDTLMFGQESAGVPETVARACDLSARIPLVPAVRSLNLAVATGIAISEALRQTGGLPTC